MPVYVDNMRAKYQGMVMCHMVADTLEELHIMAEKIGLRPEWFQMSNSGVPHYDIPIFRREMALENGATEIDRHQLFQLMKRIKNQNHKRKN